MSRSVRLIFWNFALRLANAMPQIPKIIGRDVVVDLHSGITTIILVHWKRARSTTKSQEQNNRDQDQLGKTAGFVFVGKRKTCDIPAIRPNADVCKKSGSSQQ